MQNAIDISNSLVAQEALNLVNNPAIQQMYQIINRISEILEPIHRLTEPYQQIMDSITERMKFLKDVFPYGQWGISFQHLNKISDYDLIYYHPDDMEDEEVAENEKINEIIFL